MKPLIFDFDGVIADSEKIVGEAMAATLSGFGVPTSFRDSMERYLGRSYQDTRRLMTRSFGGELPPGFEEKMNGLIRQRIKTELVAVDGVAHFLPENSNRLMAIASSSSTDWIRTGLNRFGLASFFGDRIFSAVGLPRAKPHPDVYLHAAKQIGTDCASTLIIEDSVNGIKAGKAAGGLVIGLLAGAHIQPETKAAQLAAGADYCVASYAELSALLTGTGF